MKIHNFINRNGGIEKLTDYIKSIVKPGMNIALSGGSTPKELFKYLSRSNIDFANLKFTLVDERLVNSNHPDSNEQLVREYLLQNNALKAHFTGIAPNDIEQVEKHSEAICDLVNHDFKPIDVALLGMGSDGHFASIFPDCDQLTQALDLNNPASYIVTIPKNAKYLRVGLTLSAVNRIPELILLISGQEKMDLLEKIINLDKVDNQYPISYLLQLRDDLNTFVI